MNLYSVLKNICKSMNHTITDFTPLPAGSQHFESTIPLPNLFPALSNMASCSNDRVKVSEMPQDSSNNSDQVPPSKEDPFYEPPWHKPRGKPASHPENRGVLDLVNRVTEPGSLRHAIISNPRKKLQVQPELWTSEHLKLLNVTYKVLAPHEYMTKTPIELEALKAEHTPQQYDHLKNCVRALHSEYYENLEKDERMYDIFSYLLRWLVKDSNYSTTEAKSAKEGLIFKYNDKHGKKKASKLFCRQIAYDKDMVISRLAYVDKAYLQQQGGALLPKRRKANRKIKKCQNREKHPLLGEETSNTPIDPYYVGLFITMAQLALEQLVKAGRSHAGPRDFYLFTPSEDHKSLVLYKAVVTPQFLMKFFDPYKKFDAGLVITRQDYPVGNETAVISALIKILGLPKNLHREYAWNEDEPSSIINFDDGPYVFQDVDLGAESEMEKKEATGKKRKAASSAESSSASNKKQKRKVDHARASDSQNSLSQGTKRKAADPSECSPPSKKRKEHAATDQVATKKDDAELDTALELPTGPSFSPERSPQPTESQSVLTQEKEDDPLSPPMSTEDGEVLQSPTSPPPSPEISRPSSPAPAEPQIASAQLNEREATPLPVSAQEDEDTLQSPTSPPPSPPVSSPQCTPPSSPPSRETVEDQSTTTPDEEESEGSPHTPTSEQNMIDGPLLETTFEAQPTLANPLFNREFSDSIDMEEDFKSSTEPTYFDPPSSSTSEFEYHNPRSMPPPPSPIRASPQLAGTRLRSPSLGPIDPDIPSSVPEFESTAGSVDPQVVGMQEIGTSARKRARDEDDDKDVSPLSKRRRRSR